MKNRSTNTKDPSEQKPNFWIKTVDLANVWDCRCDLEQLQSCFSALLCLFGELLNEDSKAPVCILLSLVVEKLDECGSLLTKTIEGCEEVKS